MIICRKEILNEWSEFIFSNLLPLMENKQFTKNNKRYAGFISEFILYGFLLMKGYKVHKHSIKFVSK